jgi:hypothetical protein
MTPSRRAALLPVLLAAGALAGAVWAVEIQQPAPAVPPTAPTVAQAAIPASAAPAGKPSVSTKEPIRPAQVRTAPAARAESKPSWAELTPQQQQALAPLSASWRSLGEAHKRKWIALSENFHTMPQAEQALLHSRMTEWATLSPQQRTAARLNFAEAQKVAPADKRAKWEAYQALPPEEKKRLAAGHQAAKPAPPPTAVAVQPVPQQKLARISRPKKAENPAKLTIVPGPPENNALLPPAPASSQP